MDLNSIFILQNIPPAICIFYSRKEFRVSMLQDRLNNIKGPDMVLSISVWDEYLALG